MSILVPTGPIGPLFTPRAAEGLARTVEAAGPEWADQAYDVAVKLLQSRHWIVAKHIWDSAPPTDHPQAMGGVTRRLASDGIAYCTRIVHRYPGAERSEQVWARVGIPEYTVLAMVTEAER